MATIDFPSSPSTGQSYTYNNVTYVWQSAGYWAITSDGLSVNYADKTLEESIPNPWTWTSNTGLGNTFIKMIDSVEADGYGLGMNSQGYFRIEELDSNGDFVKELLKIDPTGSTTLTHFGATRLQTQSSGVTVTGDISSTNATFIGTCEANEFKNGVDSDIVHNIGTVITSDTGSARVPAGWSVTLPTGTGSNAASTWRVTHNQGKICIPSIQIFSSFDNYDIPVLVSVQNDYFEFRVMSSLAGARHVSGITAYISVAY